MKKKKLPVFKSGKYVQSDLLLPMYYCQCIIVIYKAYHSLVQGQNNRSSGENKSYKQWLNSQAH